MGDAERLIRLLGPGSRFRDLRWLVVTDSTNRVALDEARAGTPAGLVVLADSQTAGRGRLDRRWEAAPGTALLLSLLLRSPDVPPERPHLVTAAAGLALRQACTGLGVPEPELELKWPNDLLYQGRKLAGILAEAQGDAVVVGIGCNVSAAPPGAAYLEEAIGHPVDRAVLGAALLASLEQRLGRWDEVAAEHRRRCGTVGRRVRVDTLRGPVFGEAEGVDDAGRLLVRSDAGLQAFSAGDVVHLRPAGLKGWVAGRGRPRARPGQPVALGSRSVKALILAGGAGTRLRPITHTRAKQLVPVANKPILFYGLEAIADAGITEVGMVVGDTAAEVREAVGDGSAWGVEVTYLPQDLPRGLAHAVLIARDFLGEDDFVLYLGDNLLKQSLRDFVTAFEQERERSRALTLHETHPAPSAQILLKAVPDPQRFGVAELDAAGHVVRLIEKPVDPPSDLALVGVYLFDASVHEAVASIKPSDRGELEITDAIQWLIDHGHRVRSEILSDWWIDTGKLTPLLEANRLLLETIERRIEGDVDEESQVDGRVLVEPGARIVRSTVRGPATVGAETVVSDSFIGPFTAIGRRCRIEATEVEHSVVLDDSSLVNAGRVEDSLLGHHVEVTRSERRPRAARLMVGDHSQIDLA